MTTLEQYRLDNPFCELCNPLDRLRVERPNHFLFAIQIHHIVGGFGRKDLLSNLIAVCPSCHAWCEARPQENRIICLWVKIGKGEFSDVEYHECSGMYAEGAIEKVIGTELLAGFTAVGLEVLQMLKGIECE